MATIFDKILDGEIPCHRVYEDAQVLAFLDINPLSKGHLLIIPKERKAYLHELSDEQAAAIGRSFLVRWSACCSRSSSWRARLSESKVSLSPVSRRSAATHSGGQGKRPLPHLQWSRRA